MSKQNYNVLIVDDEYLMRLAISNIIDWENQGFELVNQAENGIVALDILKSQKVDVLITDIDMPEMDGLQLAQKAKEMNPNIEVVILTCHNNFDYAKKSIELNVFDYILKLSMNETDFINILKRVKEKLDKNPVTSSFVSGELDANTQKELWKLINGDFSSESQFVQKIHNDINSGSGCLICIVEFDDKKLYISQLQEQIQSLKKLFTDEFIVLIDENLIVIIITDTTVKYNNSYFVKMLKNSDVATCRLATSYIIEDYRSLPLAYKSAQVAFDKMFYGSIDNVICYDKSFKSDDSFVPFESVFKNFSQSIFSYDTENMLISLKRDIFEISESSSLMSSTYKHLLINALLALKKTIIKFIDSDYVLNSEVTIFDKIRSANKIGLTEEYAIQAVEVMLMATHSSNISKEIIKAKNFVLNNLNDDLSISAVSKKIALNPSYFSHLFHKETKEKYVDYVNRVRVEKAKELLSATNSKIFEVGIEVGFKNTNYFTRVFKNITGTSPSDYSKNLRVAKSKDIE